VKLPPGTAVAGKVVDTATWAIRLPEHKMAANIAIRFDLLIMLLVLFLLIKVAKILFFVIDQKRSQ
jgi:hypothetical protein